LGGGGEQTLGFDGGEAPEPGVSVSVQLLGIGKGPLDRLLSPFVEAFAPVGEAVSIGFVPRILPDVAGHGLLVFGVARAGRQQRAGFRVRTMCHCLRIHPSGFYAWLKEPVSKRAKEDVRQTALIKQAWQDSGKVYGYRKLHHDLCDQGEPGNRQTNHRH